MRMLSQKNVKFQSIIREVNTSCAERSCLSVGIGNVRLWLDRVREREIERACACVHVCTYVRALMCMLICACKPSVKNSITGDFQNSPSIKGIIKGFFVGES